MASYATLQDARDEGITPAMASDSRVLSLLEEVSIAIDGFCGWHFDARARTLVLDGSGTQTLDLPVPSIEITSLVVDGDEYSLDPEELFVRGAPVEAGGDFYNPYLQRVGSTTRSERLRRGGSSRFPFGRSNISISGTFGFTEEDGSAEGRVPLAIRRAALMMIVPLVGPIAGSDPFGAQAWRVKSIKTFDQSVTFSDKFGGNTGEDGGEYTGDPAIDSILSRYARPFGVAASLGAFTL